MIFRSRKRNDGATALAEPADDRSTEELFDEIARLDSANREERDRDRDRQLVRLRHQVGARLLAEAGSRPAQPSPDAGALPDRNGSLPDISPEELTPALLRAGMLRDGCMLVRGVVPRERALTMAEDIDLAFEQRAALQDGESVDDPYYEEFYPGPPFTLAEREWVRDGGGVLAADCPKVMSDLIELFDRAGLRDVVNAYLGERAVMSMNKSTLRRARPEDGGTWHQDGAFMGDVRALNVWLSLSHCGDDAPGLDLVPRRLDEIVPTGTEGAIFEWSVSPAVAEEASGDSGVVRPIFEPGDVVLFDELCLHSTALDPAMTKNRYAVESWFFGPSAFPAEYVPLAF
jgi:hypothetical protein